MDKKEPTGSWVVALISRDYLDRLDKDLKRVDPKGKIIPYIPMVQRTKQQSKGKVIIIQDPILFNYGFFNIPDSLLNESFLSRLKSEVNAIYGWVYDRASGYNTKYSVVSQSELTLLEKTSKYFSIYNDEIVNLIMFSKYITLKGFPYDGIEAEILKVDKNNGIVKVKLQIGTIEHEVQVGFENIFYTIYEDYNSDSGPNSNTQFLDDLGLIQNRKLYAQLNYSNIENYD